MKCEKCGTSVFDTPLKRVSSFTAPPVWWCGKCIKKFESELYNNLREDNEDKIIKILKQK